MVFQKQEVNDGIIIFQMDVVIFPNMKMYVP